MPTTDNKCLRYGIIAVSSLLNRLSNILLMQLTHAVYVSQLKGTILAQT
jgi:hypothetical protein